MIRYLRLYAHFVRFSFTRAMLFRLDFSFRIVMDTLWYLGNWYFFHALFMHTPLLGDWNYDQVCIFIAGVFLADAIQMTMLANNLWWLPLAINKGDIDYHLVRPVSSLFVLSLRDFAANSFINLLMACGILAWTLARYPGPLGGLAIASYIGLVLVGVVLHYAMQMWFLIPAFWMHSSGGLREVFWSMDQLTSRPLGIYTGWVRRLLVSILPFAVIVSFPARALFEGATPLLLLHIFGVTAAAFAFMLAIWKLGLRSYSSASS